MVNEEALVEALKAKKVRGAGLDVFEVRKATVTGMGSLRSQIVERENLLFIRSFSVSPRLPYYPTLAQPPSRLVPTCLCVCLSFKTFLRVVLTRFVWPPCQNLQLANVTAVLRGEQPPTPVNHFTKTIDGSRALLCGLVRQIGE